MARRSPATNAWSSVQYGKSNWSRSNGFQSVAIDHIA
jgi:hypothetical protein